MSRAQARALFRRMSGGAPIPTTDALRSPDGYKAWLCTLTDSQLTALLEREERRRVAGLSDDELLSELTAVRM
jgi:hypothetical protein